MLPQTIPEKDFTVLEVSLLFPQKILQTPTNRQLRILLRLMQFQYIGINDECSWDFIKKSCSPYCSCPVFWAYPATSKSQFVKCTSLRHSGVLLLKLLIEKKKKKENHDIKKCRQNSFLSQQVRRLSQGQRYKK